MRTITPSGLAPLTEEDRRAMLEIHIPYRMALLRDGFRPHGARCQQDNQAFEAGAVSGRILLSFLGLKCGRKEVRLKPDQSHDSIDQKSTDDVKAPDVGGAFIDLESLSAEEHKALAVFIRGVNKACAHFTIGSDHKLDLEGYAKAAPIIFRLMAKCFPDRAESWPSWSTCSCEPGEKKSHAL